MHPSATGGDYAYLAALYVITFWMLITMLWHTFRFALHAYRNATHKAGQRLSILGLPAPLEGRGQGEG